MVTSKPINSQGTVIEEPPIADEPLAQLRAVPGNKIAAVAFWLLAAACTQQVTALFLPGMLSWAFALGLQYGLTRLESPIWSRWSYSDDGEAYLRHIGVISMGALVVDVLFNVGGAWIVVQQAHKFPPVVAIADMMNTSKDAALQQIQGWPALALCLVLGVLLAGAAEKLWNLD